MYRGWVYKNEINRIKNLSNNLAVDALKNKPINLFEINKYSKEIKNIQSLFFLQGFNDLFSEISLKKYKYLHIKLEKNNKYMYNVIIKNILHIKPIRHFFYSMQWCFFAITLFILCIKYKSKIRNKKNDKY